MSRMLLIFSTLLAFAVSIVVAMSKDPYTFCFQFSTLFF